jgi:hypothetical protein
MHADGQTSGFRLTKYPSENSLDTINDLAKKINKTHSIKIKKTSQQLGRNSAAVAATSPNSDKASHNMLNNNNKDEAAYHFQNAKLELLEPTTLSAGSSAGKLSQHLSSAGSNEAPAGKGKARRQERRSRSCSFGSEPELHIEGVVREVGIDVEENDVDAFVAEPVGGDQEVGPAVKEVEVVVGGQSQEHRSRHAKTTVVIDENSGGGSSAATGQHGRYKKNHNRHVKKSGGIKMTNVIIVDANAENIANETIKVILISVLF